MLPAADGQLLAVWGEGHGRDCVSVEEAQRPQAGYRPRRQQVAVAVGAGRRPFLQFLLGPRWRSPWDGRVPCQQQTRGQRQAGAEPGHGGFPFTSRPVDRAVAVERLQQGQVGVRH